jgi:DNA repair protein RadC
MVENMSNAELLSNLAGNASARALLQRFGSLSELHRASLDELRQVSGVGVATAVRIKSALALAARMSLESYRESPLLDTPEAVANLLREANRAYVVESFQVVLLNTRRRLIRTEVVSTGTLDTILVHSREVFALAIAARAAAMVIVHNHPSGDPTPSEGDIKVTRDLIRAGQLLKIEVLDHVILGRPTPERPKDYSSLRELGYFF